MEWTEHRWHCVSRSRKYPYTYPHGRFFSLCPPTHPHTPSLPQDFMVRLTNSLKYFVTCDLFPSEFPNDLPWIWGGYIWTFSWTTCWSTCCCFLPSNIMTEFQIHRVCLSSYDQEIKKATFYHIMNSPWLKTFPSAEHAATCKLIGDYRSYLPLKQSLLRFLRSICCPERADLKSDTLQIKKNGSKEAN